MTAIATHGHVYEVASTDLPIYGGSGLTAVPNGKILVMANVDSYYAEDTLDLSTYLPGSPVIDALPYMAYNGAEIYGASATFSGSTITFGGHATGAATANWRIGAIASLPRV